jgi:prepilin-type processing-associated H-X9-DG protein
MLNHYIEFAPGALVKASDPVRTYNSDGSLSGVRGNSEIVLMGEKVFNARDYYMETGDFDPQPKYPSGKVDQYKHGIKLGANYLYLDGHVDISPPKAIENSLDPWDPGGTASQGY